MSYTREQLIEEFSEFRTGSPALLDAKLAEAKRRTPVRIWGDLVDDGVKYLAAHLLACSPYARELKMVAKDGTTWYGKERERLERTVASGFRVTG